MFGIISKSNSWEKYRVLTLALRRFKVASFIRSKDGENSENDAKTSEGTKNVNEASAKEKLSDLLKLMTKDGPLVKQKEEGLKLAQPKKKEKPKATMKVKDGLVLSEEMDRQLVEATKKVAESLGGDVKETESELLQKLLAPKGPTNLSELIGGMQIESSKESKTRREMPKDWSEIRRETAQLKKPARPIFKGGQRERFRKGELDPVDLFGGPRLGIFGKEISKDVTSPESLKVWDSQEEREIRLATAHPPRNYYQHMILWTEQGKLWKFPIDNEQGLDEEKKVFFTEHVFLEPHLDPWCPKKGPVRHFMELVCIGLSKNPYMSVQEKKDTIHWYAEYFEGKKDILKEAGALPL
ncbi:small ribosomal subunit protein mS31 isoform X2 [Hetaerina americana]|uniref:small ribosomal subunit protein mS31 isoform X2 n=1 Tax=Hetaerina americana TaxID=62018 RepID=UPI003A7F3E4C